MVRRNPPLCLWGGEVNVLILGLSLLERSSFCTGS